LKEEITMLQIGKMNTLTVIELEDRGAWLAVGRWLSAVDDMN